MISAPGDAWLCRTIEACGECDAFARLADKLSNARATSCFERIFSATSPSSDLWATSGAEPFRTTGNPSSCATLDAAHASLTRTHVDIGRPSDLKNSNRSASPSELLFAAKDRHF